MKILMNGGKMPKRDRPTTDESVKLLLSAATSFAILLLSVGGFIFLLSRAGCF